MAAAVLMTLIPAISQAAPDSPRQALDDARAQLDDLDTRVSLAVEEYDAAAYHLERLQAQQRDTQQEVAGLTRQVDELEQDTAAFVREMYKSGPTTGLAAALRADGITEAGRDLAMANRITRQRQAELEQLGSRRAQLDAARSRMAVQIDDATRRTQQLAAKRDTIDGMIAGQHDEVVALQGRVTALESQQAQAVASRDASAASAAPDVRAFASDPPATSDPPKASDSPVQAPNPPPPATKNVAAPTPPAADDATPAAPPPKPAPPAEPEPAQDGVRKGASTAVEAALSQVGKPYRYAGAGPDSYDCSGLTQWAWAHAGVTLPHYSKAQFEQNEKLDRNQLQPGDLIFFGSPIHHVAMYVGGGRVVEAPYTGKNVRTSDTALSRDDIVGYARV